MPSGIFLDNKMQPHNVVERVTDGIIVTESDHTAIHKGYAYKGLLEITTLAGGATLSWSFVTPEAKYVHFKNLRLSALSASCKVEFLKDVDITVDTGTAVGLVNQNLNSASVAGVTVKLSPTYTGGVVVDGAYVLIDSTNQSVGSATSSAFPYEEIVLEPDSQYVIKVTNLDPTEAVAKAIVQFFFYEEPAGEF